MPTCRYKYCENETHSEYIHYCSIKCNQLGTGYMIDNRVITGIVETEEENEQEEITA